MDNIFVERLWRSVQYEEIYLKEYDSVKHLRKSLKTYFQFYNEQRPHHSLNDQTPWEAYHKQGLVTNAA